MRNRMAKGKRVWPILAIGLIMLLLLTACASAPPTEEGKVVRFGYMSPFTGPGATEAIALSAVLDYLEYFNEEQRIPGVTLQVTWVDVQIHLSKFASAYSRLRDQGIFIMMSNQTQGIEAYHSRFERDQIPLYTGNPCKEYVYPPGWYYFRSPTWGEQAAANFDYIMENWQEERPPKLALMLVDTGLGKQPLPEAADYAESLGIEVLPLEFLPSSYMVLDATVQLLRISQGGADFAYITGIQPTAGPILRDAERLGLLDEIQFMGMESTGGSPLIELAGAAGEGYLYGRTIPTFGEVEVPGVKLMLDKQMEYRGRQAKEDEYITGWVGASIICEAIRKAVENVGYENLDGPAVKEGLDSIKDFNVYGLATITYNPPYDHRGSDKLAIYQVRGGEIVRVTDWRSAPTLMPEGS